MKRQTTETWLAQMRGSRPWTSDEAGRVIEAWEGSGTTVTAFARGAGLVPQRLFWWIKRLGRRPQSAGGVPEGAERAAPVFLPVVVGESAAGPSWPRGPAVTVEARHGVRIEVVELDARSAAWVARVVRSLAEEAS
jgi:hypothetical protein